MNIKTTLSHQQEHLNIAMCDEISKKVLSIRDDCEFEFHAVENQACFKETKYLIS